MSPKEDSKANLMAVASSRDAQPNTDSVIRSRRTYAYDNGTDTQLGSSGSLVLDRILDRVLDHYIVKFFVRPFVRKPDCVRYRPRNNYLDRSYEIAAATDNALSNKLDRMNHDITQGFMGVSQRLESVEKRLEAIESRMSTMEARMVGMESRGAGMEVPMDNMEMEGSMLGASVL
ncbi:hypothetical protein NUW58_g942 [Xylaria curta]|uniref:Uncharacterized protein n=1 Tax=Xylaria curta TaxID=42375 RepID=A0ACC1PNZ3_9PEZI|nr:hypothetical protein NUW58_g942 [Xylaria curta]